MKSLLRLIWLVAILFSTLNRSVVASPLAVDPNLGQTVGQCHFDGEPSSGKEVILFKQWNLAPAQDLRTAQDLPPQHRNLQASYSQLERWIGNHQIKTILTEGCEGTLTSKGDRRFNGFTIPDLRALIFSKGPDRVPAQTAAKLKARFGENVHAQCADQGAYLKEQTDLFSEAKGIISFYSRLNQAKAEPARSKVYLEGVIDLYKLQKETNVSGAMVFLRAQLKKTADQFRVLVKRKAEHLARTVASADGPQVALLTNGIQAAQLVSLFEKEKVRCTVIEPSGYSRDSEAFLEKLDRVLELAQ